VYLTLLSIVVALAAEGLLNRLDQIEALFDLNSNSLLIWAQSLLSLLLAAVFWWVAVRWVGALPWRFGFFDSIGPLALLVAFHFLVASVGASAGRWFASLGLISVAGSIIYVINARRAISLRAPSLHSQRTMILRPAGVGVATGLASVLVGAVATGQSLGPGVQLVLNGVVAAGLVAFAIMEHRVWQVLIEHSPRAEVAA
jgi:hypothetical protein